MTGSNLLVQQNKILTRSYKRNLLALTPIRRFSKNIIYRKDNVTTTETNNTKETTKKAKAAENDQKPKSVSGWVDLYGLPEHLEIGPSLVIPSYVNPGAKSFFRHPILYLKSLKMLIKFLSQAALTIGLLKFRTKATLDFPIYRKKAINLYTGAMKYYAEGKPQRLSEFSSRFVQFKLTSRIEKSSSSKLITDNSNIGPSKKYSWKWNIEKFITPPKVAKISYVPSEDNDPIINIVYRFHTLQRLKRTLPPTFQLKDEEHSNGNKDQNTENIKNKNKNKNNNDKTSTFNSLSPQEQAFFLLGKPKYETIVREIVDYPQFCFSLAPDRFTGEYPAKLAGMCVEDKLGVTYPTVKSLTQRETISEIMKAADIVRKMPSKNSSIFS